MWPARTFVWLRASLLVVAIGAGSVLAAQSQIPPTPKSTPPQENQEIDQDDVISISTTEVLLPVTVRDRSGLLVSDLTRKDFRVFENGIEQSLSELSLRQVPVDVVLMIDASSSAAKNLDDFRIAADGFALHLDAEDRVSLIQFDDRVALLQDWTRSLAQLRRSLKRIAPGTFTRFHDAVLLASRDQLARPAARHAVIVLTDGIDSGRGSTFATALRAALQSQTAIYVVSNTQIERAAKQEELSPLLSATGSVRRFNQIRIDDLRLGLAALDASEQNLEELTAATGGRLYKPASFRDLEKTYAEVADELRHQYALYYSPLNAEKDGQFRRVRVETSNPTHQVTSRIGYFAGKH